MLKRLVLLTLVVMISLSSFTGCKRDREYNEAEVIAAAKLLIEKSTKVNDIFYGKGIAIIDDKSYANGSYYMADPLAVAEYGIETVEDMKELARECFTVAYSNLLINTVLSSVSDDSGIQGLARYYQKVSSLDDTPECIMVLNDDGKYLLKDKITYNYDSLKVLRSEGEYVIISVYVDVENPDGKTQNKEIEIKLLEENGVWKIDTPTYARYTEGMNLS